MAQRQPGPIPKRWLNCPRKAMSLFANKFLAFKTPLGPQFNEQVPEESRFTPSMLFMSMKSYKVKLGLWIDLTNTTRFYAEKDVIDMNCEYIKVKCRGHGETPSAEQTSAFIKLVTEFMNKNPLEIIGVHCTHGFNRTGFLLISYMVEEQDWSVEAAINEFAKIRPPGIYKQDYLHELYKRYDDVQYTPCAPYLPDWCNEEENDYDDDENEDMQKAAPSNSSNSTPRGKGRKETTHKKAFMLGVRGVEPFNEQPRFAAIQKKAQSMCGWSSNGFPGSQPVSMDMKNIQKLHEKPYRVSWKADGNRYLMLIDGEGEVYFFDRDNCAFKVFGLRFLQKRDLKKHLKDTLLDGEMVIDKVNGADIPRFLVYDVIKFEGSDIGKTAFYPNRLRCIEHEIVAPRHRAMQEGIIDKSREPFSIRNKEFWHLTMAKALLGEKFARTLSHEPDGLIFQPSMEPYVAGRCDDVLKWKPSHMNSIDFRLKIVTESGAGILPRKIGQLFVGQMEQPFQTMAYTKDIKHLDGKIIECKYDEKGWRFMRERTDKSFPNSYTTAQAVLSSIKYPVTKEYLLELIDSYRYRDDMDAMPPPKRVRR